MAYWPSRAVAEQAAADAKREAVDAAERVQGSGRVGTSGSHSTARI